MFKCLKNRNGSILTKIYKVRDFVIAGILKAIYHAAFESHIHYACFIWGHTVCKINRLFRTSKESIKTDLF